MKYLIVGLGNPTAKYINTRHNAGFMALESYLERKSQRLHFEKRFNANIFITPQAIFLEPQTFMNCSGFSLRAVSEFYKIDTDQILVIHDDLDIALGALRFKKGGSSGGHNGLKSIDDEIGRDYVRARIGIGSPNRPESLAPPAKNVESSAESKPHTQSLFFASCALESPAQSVVDYVLEPFASHERVQLQNVFENVAGAIDSFLADSSLEILQNTYTKRA